MRSLTRLFARRRPPPDRRGAVVAVPADEPVLELTLADLYRPDRVRDATEGTKLDLTTLYGEIGLVADYVGRLRREIASVKPNQIVEEALPATREDLAGIQAATQATTDTILTVAEALIATDAPSVAAYRATVHERVVSILEACSFQDLTGQRLARAIQTLETLETRLRRFNDAVAIADDPHGAAMVGEARREILLVEGPGADRSILQPEIDRFFA